MKSKITNGETEFLFSTNVLGKYNVKYYRCIETGFIQTEDPYWLDEAYSSAIASLDLGLLYRNIKLVDATKKILTNNFNVEKKFLDYAGGYGIFTRLMRDNGYDFYHHDKFCENIFAKYFELENAYETKGFETLTAFEVFEHLTNPLEEISAMLEFSNSILFSTELVPVKKIESPADWWYFVPETGQHISFYTKKSLDKIGEILGLQVFSNNANLHLLTRRKDIGPGILDDLSNPFADKNPKKQSFFKNIFKGNKSVKNPAERPTLLQKDFEYVKGIITRR